MVPVIAVTSGHCVSIPADYERLGSHRFSIGTTSAGTRTVYALRGTDGQLKRLVIVQDEAIDSGSATRYVYPLAPSEQLSGVTMRASTFAFSTVLALANKAPEATATDAFLRGLGIAEPALWAVRRDAWHNAVGRSERIIFFMEAVDENVLSLQDLGQSDLNAWSKVFEVVAGDARSAFSPVDCSLAQPRT